MNANDILHQPLRAVNIGLSLLEQALNQQDVDTVNIAWRPPRQVNLSPRILEILSKMEPEERQ